MQVFVAARGNAFMRDIAGWLVEAALATGRDAHLVTDHLPANDGSINLVVAPHEFFPLFDAPLQQRHEAAAVSIGVATEQPGTPWFDTSLEWCRFGRRALDINLLGVDALRAAGVTVQHLPLGAVESMTAVPAGLERTHDVVFLGGLDPRRAAVLAGLAPTLWRYATELRLFRFDRPIRPQTPGVVFGNDKYRLLAQSRLLLNVHRERPGHGHAPAYFEWARMVEAMANGCVVVTEPSEGYAPLVAGEHFVEAPTDQLGATIEQLLGQPERIVRIADAARAMVNGPLALSTTLEPILASLEHDVLPQLRTRPAPKAQRAIRRPTGTPRQRLVTRTAFRPYLPMQREAKRLALADTDALRRLDALRCLLQHGTPQHIAESCTPAYVAALPVVTVVVPLYNQATTVGATLDSIVASTGVPFEVIVVEDHATDASRTTVEQYLRTHPEVPMLLLAKAANEGLSAARNTGFGRARGEFVLPVDADNQVYPTCLSRLTDALVAQPTAAAAYATLEDFGDAPGLRSALAWDVERLCEANYIDAQALWRLSSWERLGGFDADVDRTIGGWEDWDLWLRLAASGGQAISVPQILGRYRVQQHSMVALTNLALDDAVAAMRTRHPALPWPSLS